ncbi:MAG: VOC family protein [Pseudomonadota bacterium]|nr:VOC family protein [Pseudomonadota bacterium]
MSVFKVKGFSWVGVGTDDFERSLAFFTEALGLTVDTLADRQAILRVADGQQLEIFGREGRGKSLNMPPTIAFEVDDIEQAKAALVAGGAELIGDVGEWNGHTWLYFRSPDGHLFEVKTSPPATE